MRPRHDKQKPCITLAHAVPRNFYFIEVRLCALPQTAAVPPSLPGACSPSFSPEKGQTRAPGTAVPQRLKQNGCGSGRLPEPRPGPAPPGPALAAPRSARFRGTRAPPVGRRRHGRERAAVPAGGGGGRPGGEAGCSESRLDAL